MTMHGLKGWRAELLEVSMAGLHAMMALKAGARHVTAVDRWLYMALACRESLVRATCSHAVAQACYGVMPAQACPSTHHTEQRSELGQQCLQSALHCRDEHASL